MNSKMTQHDTHLNQLDASEQMTQGKTCQCSAVKRGIRLGLYTLLGVVGIFAFLQWMEF